jgi:hypothetical protein
MKRPLRTFLQCLLAGLVLQACSLVSGSDGDPEATPSSTSTTGSSSSSSASSSAGSSSSSSSSGSPSDTVTGNGIVKTEEREVAGFDRISISGIGELIVEQTGEESLTIEAEENLLPLLVSEVDGDRLTMGIRRDSSIRATKPIVYRLTVKALREVGGAGTVGITATGLDAADFAYDSSGTVKSVLSGKAERQKVTMTGTGTFDGRNLPGRSAEIDLSGTGEALVNVTETLTARASGTAAVRYLGDPQVDRQTSGLGKVEKAQ